MNRIALFGVLIGIAFAAFCAGVYSKRFRITPLQPSELKLKQAPIQPPTVEDCSRLRRYYQALVKSQVLDKTPSRNAGLVSEEEVVIYRTVLRQWVEGDGSPLKVATQTYFLNPFLDSEDVSCDCLKSFDAETFARVSHSFHNLTRAVLIRKNMTLVSNDHPFPTARNSDRHMSPEELAEDDIAHGILSLSEIAFDQEHQHAVVSYSFHCGMLCGSGRTILLEKIDGEWREAKTECGGWIS